MMKKLNLLILYLLIATVSYSQILYPKILSDSTVIITNQQLKNANKLFYQGQMYKQLYSEDTVQVSNYKKLVNNYDKIDSIQVKNINTLQKSLTKANKKLSWTYGTLGSIILILTGILIFK